VHSHSSTTSGCVPVIEMCIDRDALTVIVICMQFNKDFIVCFLPCTAVRVFICNVETETKQNCS